MLFKGLVGCSYQNLKEMCLAHAVKSNPEVQCLNKDLPHFQADLKQTWFQVLELPLRYVVKNYITHGAVLLGEGILLIWPGFVVKKQNFRAV